MSLLPDVLALMPDTVTVQHLVSESTKGEKTYGSAVTYPARVYGRNKLIRSLGGQERVSSVTAIIGTAALISTKDIITLPARFTPNAPPIMAVYQHTDEDGPHHSTVYF